MVGEIGLGVGGFLAGMYGANQANAAASNAADKQMYFQQQQSSTAHQREVDDLKKAGLNPILSANAGASSGPGASAPVENSIGRGLSTARDAIQTAIAKKQTDSQVLLQGAQAAAAAAAAQRDATTAKNLETQTQALQSQLKSIGLKAKTTEQQEMWNQRMMKFDNIMNRIQQGLGIANSAKDLINPLNFGRKLPGYLEDKGRELLNKNTGEIILKKY